MKYNRLNLIKFGILGGILGGVIALIGFLILTPSTNSVFLFILLRVVIGVVVSVLVGPLLAGDLFNKNKN